MIRLILCRNNINKDYSTANFNWQLCNLRLIHIKKQFNSFCNNIRYLLLYRHYLLWKRMSIRFGNSFKILLAISYFSRFSNNNQEGMVLITEKLMNYYQKAKLVKDCFKGKELSKMNKLKHWLRKIRILYKV